MNIDESIKAISDIVDEHLSRGLIPDSDTIHFIKSAYGLTDPGEILEFIRNGHDSGAVIDLLSYPSGYLRKSVEKSIPHEGFPLSDIERVCNTFIVPENYFILLNEKKIIITQNDSIFCFKKIMRRLNLHVCFTYLSGIKNSLFNTDIYDVRAILRRKIFISGDDNYGFIKILITNYNSMDSKNTDEFLTLINAASEILNNSEETPQDILSAKRNYYENAYLESLEFTRLLKAYSMEFIMMKKIQPPLISAEEALSMISVIDRLSAIVYGLPWIKF